MLHEKNGMSGAGQGTPALSPRAGRSRSAHGERRVRGDKTTPSPVGILSIWAAWAAASPGSRPRPACCQGVPRVPAMPMALRRTRTAPPPSRRRAVRALRASRPRLQPPGDDVSGRAGADGGAREEGGGRGEERRTATGSLAEDAASVSWPGGFSPRPGSESSSGPGPVHRGTRLCRTIPAPRHVQHGPCATCATPGGACCAARSLPAMLQAIPAPRHDPPAHAPPHPASPSGCRPCAARRDPLRARCGHRNSAAGALQRAIGAALPMDQRATVSLGVCVTFPALHPAGCAMFQIRYSAQPALFHP